MQAADRGRTSLLAAASPQEPACVLRYLDPGIASRRVSVLRFRRSQALFLLDLAGATHDQILIEKNMAES